MRRREFILYAVGALGVSSRKIEADHHVVSADPLVVAFDLGSLEGRYTRVEDFYVRNHYEAPAIVGPCSLRIEGEVERPQNLTLGDLRRRSEHKIGALLECAGDPVRAVSLVSDGVWQGWPLRDIVALARPRGSGAYLQCFGRDGFARSLPLNDALNGGLLVTALNGRPLTGNHGAPWRVLFPGWYGMNSVKWVERIVVAQAPLPPIDHTYLELRKGPGGSIEKRPLPRIQVKSIITDPQNDSVLHRGRALVRGLAWSGEGAIAKVEVSADAGASWIPAMLDRSGSHYDWALWRATVELNRAGVVEMVCRAVDEKGHTQPARRDPQRIDLYAYNVYDRVRCVVV
jgi:DMSO/TMAO reductase YedYZ molybdopterin-dependent catalytic subunit